MPPAKKSTSKDAATPKKGKRTGAAKSTPSTKQNDTPVTAVGKSSRSRKSATADSTTRAKEPVPVNPNGPDLLIVESPAKAKTINRYLGNKYRVLASYGHVRDLPVSGKDKSEEVTGINIANGWKLRYVVQDRKGGASKGGRVSRRTPQDVLDELRREAGKSNRVLLATDPDREGEAIAWHIKDELGLDDNRTFRVRFNEITKPAIQRALSQPEAINMDRVKAQEARRALDRVVGYPLSSLLGNKVARNLSAGRVQSVAVRLIVERELEIEAFKSEEYWKITALLAPQGAGIAYTADPARSKIFAKKKGTAGKGQDQAGAGVAEADTDTTELADGELRNGQLDETPTTTKPAAGLPEPPTGSFLAELVRWDGDEFKCGSEADADRIAAILQQASYVVSKLTQQDKPERPQPPFTTSTLQQQANIRLRLKAKDTMSIAQKLYEGVDLGSDGPVALITYMRTDSTRVSADALAAVRAHIQNQYGSRYLPNSPNTYASGKSAQEAHEAIRPTDLSWTPERVKPFLDDRQYRLYALIYNRFVASQMTPAIFAVTTIEVQAGKGLFRATGRIEKFDGYRKVLPPVGKQQETTLPAVSEQQTLDKLDLFESQHFTQPPPRYNEASLVRALEKEGIGRPSTYATIIQTIQDRGYVEQRDRRFYATEIGKVVTKLLIEHFPRVLDLKFTSQMEQQLDEIETGNADYVKVLSDFWGDFSEALEKAQKSMPPQKAVETGEACPKCGKPLIRLFRRTGEPFVGCSAYKPEDGGCKYIKPSEGELELAWLNAAEINCPFCGKPMVERRGPRGVFLGCSGYDKDDPSSCPTTMAVGPDGKTEVTTAPSDQKCNKCGKPFVKRKGPRGMFFACTGYPECKNALDERPDGTPAWPMDTGLQCDKCGKELVIKKGPRGPFLSCAGYPACRNAKPLTDELREKFKDQLPAPPPKSQSLPAVQITTLCPLCNSPMKLRNAARGYFLGCSKYPKCRGTAQVPPEVLSQIESAPANA